MVWNFEPLFLKAAVLPVIPFLCVNLHLHLLLRPVEPQCVFIDDKPCFL